MIDLKFLVLKSGQIVGVNAEGHSEFEENGKDIVCAAVSSAIFMVINTITKILNISIKTHIDEKNARIFFLLENINSKTCSDILKGLKLHFESLKKMYPKNLKVSYMEV